MSERKLFRSTSCSDLIGASIRLVRKLQFPNKFLLKTHFCKALARFGPLWPALARFGPKKCKTCSGTDGVPEQVQSFAEIRLSHYNHNVVPQHYKNNLIGKIGICDANVFR